jgi:hypothetical protein
MYLYNSRQYLSQYVHRIASYTIPDRKCKNEEG